MFIKNIETTKELTEIIGGLIREGLTFEAHKVGSVWEIELKGGY